MTANRKGWIECAPETLERARGGDATGMNDLLRGVQDPVYGLALRMLADPEAARDATQDVS